MDKPDRTTDSAASSTHARPRRTVTTESNLKQLVHELAIPEERAHAEASLKRINDPLAVPAIWEVLVAQTHHIHDDAARLLAQIHGPEATSRLATLAMQDLDAPVRTWPSRLWPVETLASISAR